MWIGIVVGVLVLIEISTYAPNSTNTDAPPISPPVQPEVPVPPAQPVQPTVPAQPVQPVVTAPTAPDIAGLWRTLSGETYQFAQQGNQLRFTAQAGGQPAGMGEGQLDGNLLRLSMTLTPNGVPMGVLNCNMQASPDFSRFVGMCQGANGQFPAQMFR